MPREARSMVMSQSMKRMSMLIKETRSLGRTTASPKAPWLRRNMRLHFKSQLARHGFDGIESHIRGIGFVVNVEKTYSAFIFRDNSSGCDDACATRSTTSLGSDCHADFANPRSQLDTLIGVSQQTIFQRREICKETSMPLRQTLELRGELRGKTNLVLHPRNPPKKAFWNRHHPRSLSSPSWLRKPLRLCRAWVPLPGVHRLCDSARHVSAKPHAHHDVPCSNNEVGGHEILLY